MPIIGPAYAIPFSGSASALGNGTVTVLDGTGEINGGLNFLTLTSTGALIHLPPGHPYVRIEANQDLSTSLPVITTALGTTINGNEANLILSGSMGSVYVFEGKTQSNGTYNYVLVAQSSNATSQFEDEPAPSTTIGLIVDTSGTTTISSGISLISEGYHSSGLDAIGIEVTPNIQDPVIVTTDNGSTVTIQGLAGTGLSLASDSTTDLQVDMVGLDQTAISSNSATVTDVLIYSSGDINVLGLSTSGAEANTASTGTVTINNAGDMNLNGFVNTGMVADGLLSTASNLAAGRITVDGTASMAMSAMDGGTATNIGIAQVKGIDATGMKAEARDTVPVQAQVDNLGTITVTGESGIGMHVVRSNGSNSGTITASSANSVGMMSGTTGITIPDIEEHWEAYRATVTANTWNNWPTFSAAEIAALPVQDQLWISINTMLLTSGLTLASVIDGTFEAKLTASQATTIADDMLALLVAAIGTLALPSLPSATAALTNSGILTVEGNNAVAVYLHGPHNTFTNTASGVITIGEDASLLSYDGTIATLDNFASLGLSAGQFENYGTIIKEVPTNAYGITTITAVGNGQLGQGTYTAVSPNNSYNIYEDNGDWFAEDQQNNIYLFEQTSNGGISLTPVSGPVGTITNLTIVNAGELSHTNGGGFYPSPAPFTQLTSTGSGAGVMGQVILDINNTVVSVSSISPGFQGGTQYAVGDQITVQIPTFPGITTVAPIFEVASIA